jgi:hypothetical protein
MNEPAVATTAEIHFIRSTGSRIATVAVSHREMIRTVPGTGVGMMAKS